MTTAKRPPRVLLGEITGVHGTRGDVVVRSFTAEPEGIAAYGRLSDASGAQEFRLHVVRVTSRGVVARIEGITDRTAAERLKGTKLYIERERLPSTDGSEFYHADLIGLKAVAPDGSDLGEIVGVQNFGAGDLLEFKPASGEATEFIPFQAQWVPDIDLATGRIVIVRLPEDGDLESGAD